LQRSTIACTNKEVALFAFRYLWISCAVGVGVFFVARGVHDLREGRSETHSTEPRVAPLRPDAGGAVARVPYEAHPDPRSILARNIFDSATGPLWPPSQPEPPAGDLEPEAVPDGGEEPRCETRLRIAAALYDPQRPERSQVVLRGPEIDARRYGQGMTVGDYTVTEIHPHAVRLQSSDGACWVGMFNAHSREKVALEDARSAPKEKRKTRTRAKSKRKSAKRPRMASQR
jgi:hypothetical protein